MLKIGGQKIPFITVILVISESLLIGLALFLSAVISLSPLSITTQSINSETFIRLILVIVVCEFCLYYYDLYDFQVVGRRAVLFVQLLQALGVACFLLAFVYFLQPSLSMGRGVALLAAPAILAIILSWRLLLDASAPLLRRTEKMLVLGMGKPGIDLVKELMVRPEFSTEVVGFLDEHESGANVGQMLESSKIVGKVSDVTRIAGEAKVDRVIISLAERRGKMPIHELLQLRFAGVRVEDAHTMFERVTGRILLEYLSPSWLILSEGFRKSGITRFLKRTTDLVISLVALVIAAPIMLLVAAAIVVESGRPVLFRQRRVGLEGREFEMLKFRSMYQDSERHGPAWAKDADRRVTRVGYYIRRFRLDELPQMINVLLGDMSIAGPRPEQPYFVQLLEQSIPYYGLRHTVRPGITGWAQIKFMYGASVEESKTKLEYDLFYIKHLSVFLDLAIIFETVKVLLSGRGAK
ncbi:MAG TPA: TIGR03013 family XrtA/PEP-CTERM system glycosyltransferase [Terriglobales bacterium]|nr:TIGR03013 family XrtA/PEP-CTERM system glycosyltransferase [Terriglobales bacterium]